MMNVKDPALFIAIIALAIAVVSLPLSMTGNTVNTAGEWQCIAQQCSRWATGQEWVNRNCELNETGQFNCLLVINDQQVMLPLSIINVSAVRSCSEWECTMEVWSRTPME